MRERLPSRFRPGVGSARVPMHAQGPQLMTTATVE